MYTKRHDGLIEASNRLVGVIAICERRIGQELRAAPKNKSAAEKGIGRAGANAVQHEDRVPTLADLGVSKNESASYQELAHPDVAENVILDAVATAGARGEAVTKADIQRAVRAEIDRKRQERGGPPRSQPPPGSDPALIEAAAAWNAEALTRVR